MAGQLKTPHQKHLETWSQAGRSVCGGGHEQAAISSPGAALQHVAPSPAAHRADGQGGYPN